MTYKHSLSLMWSNRMSIFNSDNNILDKRVNVFSSGFLATIAVFFLLASPVVNAQQKVTDGTTPLGLSPGAPSGSYTLTEFESMNLFNGNLNFSLPLVSVSGRGDARFQIAMHIDRKWRSEEHTSELQSRSDL